MIRKSILPTRISQLARTLGKLAGAAIVSSAAAVAPAQATVLDFDDAFALVLHGDVILEDGFVVQGLSNAAGATWGADFVGMTADGTDPTSCLGGNCPANNPTTYYAAVNDGLMWFANTNGHSFNIQSFSASFLGNSQTTYPTTPGYLRLQAFRANGSYVLADFALGGLVNSKFRFNNYVTPAAFAAIPFVEVYAFGYSCAPGCVAFGSDRGQFGIDNIDLHVIPEPATGAIFGLGLLGLGAFARRRKA